MFLVGGSPCVAQDTRSSVPINPDRYSFIDSKVLPFHSSNVGVDYKLYVQLPRDYEKNTQNSYPLLLLLDADYTFPLISTISRFLSDHDELPELIVVGIAYPGVAEEKYGPILKVNRTRDYTPSNVATGGYGADVQKSSGGANHYLDFISKELIPYLKENFRTKANDIGMVGYSYGGLLGSYSLVTRPDLFQRYIIVSPSLWWDKKMIFRLEKKQALKDLKARAFFAIGSLETSKHGTFEMVDDTRNFVTALNNHKYPHCRTQFWIGPNETHHSIFADAAMRGLRWVYSK